MHFRNIRPFEQFATVLLMVLYTSWQLRRMNWTLYTEEIQIRVYKGRGRRSTMVIKIRRLWM